MIDPNDNLERLVTRYLDGECTPEERRQLEALIKRDRDAEAFFEETAALDRELDRTMRRALGAPLVRRRRMPMWMQFSRVVGLSVAACVAFVVIRGAGEAVSPPPRESARPQAAASWFAPRPAAADVLDESAQYDRPRVRLDKSERDWFLVPGDVPGEFLIVEMKHVKRRMIPVQEDF